SALDNRSSSVITRSVADDIRLAVSIAPHGTMSAELSAATVTFNRPVVQSDVCYLTLTPTPGTAASAAHPIAASAANAVAVAAALAGQLNGQNGFIVAAKGGQITVTRLTGTFTDSGRIDPLGSA